MKPEEIAEFFIQTNRLKKTIRYSSCNKNVQENTAGHSWHIALMVPTIARELNLKINIEHAMELACVHDLAENVLEYDFDSYLLSNGTLSAEKKEASEKEEMERIKKKFGFGNKIYSLWEEYEEAKTPEAKFVKALDKLESHVHVIERGGSGEDAKGAAHQITYADKAVMNYPQLKPILKELKKKLRPLMEKQGLEWKSEYDYPNTEKNN